MLLNHLLENRWIQDIRGTLSVMVEFIDVWDLVTIQFNLFVVVFL